MKIKTLMDFLSKDSPESGSEQGAVRSEDENIIYMEDSRVEYANERAERKDLLSGGTQWSDQYIGELLVAQGKLNDADVDRIINHQRDRGIYFGEAAIDLDLANEDDILQALSSQFGYTYGQGDDASSREMVMADAPFGDQAEEFRSIRAKLLNNWLNSERKTLAVVSPGNQEGRSYVAANIALAFSQLGRSTLLIDADMRAPRQQEIFNFTSRFGLSMLLAGRVGLADLDILPNRVSAFQNLSVLGCGPVPPNPSELLSNGRLPSILRELKKYFDVIIIDAPPASYQADVVAIGSIAGSALLVARSGYSRMEDTRSLISILDQAQAKVVGAILNQY